MPNDDPTVILTVLDEDRILRPLQMSRYYTVVTITMFAGRTEETKRRLIAAVTDAVASWSGPREEIDVVLVELPLENFARGGIPASDVDLGFDVDI